MRIETFSRKGYEVSDEAMSITDTEARMRAVLAELTATGLDAEFVMQKLFLDDSFGETIEAGTTGEDFYDVFERLEDEIG